MFNNANEVKKCTRCNSTVLLQYFDTNRKGELFKTCNNCRNRSKKHYADNSDKLNEYYREWREQHRIPCSKCGTCIPSNQMKEHIGGFPCMTHGMEPKPEYEQWLIEQPVEHLNKHNKLSLQTLINRNN